MGGFCKFSSFQPYQAHKSCSCRRTPRRPGGRNRPKACLFFHFEFNTYQICRAFVLFLFLPTLTFSITGPFSLSLSLTMFYSFQLLNVRLTKPDEDQSCSKLLLSMISNKPKQNEDLRLSCLENLDL